jgi:hypothetical protein
MRYKDDKAKFFGETALETLRDYSIDEVLPQLYSISSLEKYVAKRRKQKIAEIKEVINSDKQYVYISDGEDVVFDRYFFEDALELYNCGKDEFLKYINSKSITTDEILEFHSKVVNDYKLVSGAIIRLKNF